MHTDKDRIAALGGPAKVAGLLGYSKQGGVQRVQNWITRGIPSKVKLDRPDLFLTNQKALAESDSTPSITPETTIPSG